MEISPKHPDVAAMFSRLLQDLGISGNQLATALGTSQQAISNYTSGRNKPSREMLATIAKEYPAIDALWLITGEGDPFPNGRYNEKQVTKVTLPVSEVAEPAAPYGAPCMAPTTVVPLSRQLGEAHARILELETELKDERKQARQDLRLQATYYNSVKEEQSQLITRLYAKIDEYELILGYRKPTPAERQQQEQAGSGAPRMKVISLGARYRTPEPTEVDAVKASTEQGGKLLPLYPTAEVSHYKAA